MDNGEFNSGSSAGEGACARLLEFQDDLIDGQRIARGGTEFLHLAVAFGAQHVLHLHRLDHRQGFAGLDFEARFHGKRREQSGIGDSRKRDVSGGALTGICALRVRRCAG